jgi:hypothetical protein
MDDNWDPVSNLAGELLTKRRFIFKGGEPPGEVSLFPSPTMCTILLITVDSFVQKEDLRTFLLLRRSNHIFPRIPRAKLFSKQVHPSVRLHLRLLRYLF